MKNSEIAHKDMIKQNGWILTTLITEIMLLLICLKMQTSITLIQL